MGRSLQDKKRPNGAGSVVKLKYRDKATNKIVESRYYYIIHRVNGRQIRESSKTDNKQVTKNPRRSATRNLIRAGVDRGTAMKITSQKTEHVFERNNIVSTDDIREALVKVGQYAKMQERAGRKQVAQIRK